MTPDEARDHRAANIIALHLRCHLRISEDNAHAVAADSIANLRRAGDWGPRPITLPNTRPGTVCAWNRCEDPATGWRWDLRSKDYAPACTDHLADRPPLRIAGPHDAA